MSEISGEYGGFNFQELPCSAEIRFMRRFFSK